MQGRQCRATRAGQVCPHPPSSSLLVPCHQLQQPLARQPRVVPGAFFGVVDGTAHPVFQASVAIVEAIGQTCNMGARTGTQARLGGTEGRKRMSPEIGFRSARLREYGAAQNPTDGNGANFAAESVEREVMAGGGMGGRSEMTRPACRTRAAARAAASSSMRPRRAASCTAVVAPNPSPIPAAAAATLGQRRRQRLWSRRRRRLGGSSTPARERKRPAWQPASRQYGASPDGPPHMPAYPSPKRP